MHFTLCTSLYALHSMHFTLCTSLYALHSMHFTLCTSLYALHSMHFTLCASLCALHSVHLPLCTSLYALCSMRFTLCTSLYALHSMHFALCTSLYALHSMHFTLCTSLYALHSMHFTLCTSVYVVVSGGSARKNPSRCFREKKSSTSGRTYSAGTAHKNRCDHVCHSRRALLIYEVASILCSIVLHACIPCSKLDESIMFQGECGLLLLFVCFEALAFRPS